MVNQISQIGEKALGVFSFSKKIFRLFLLTIGSIFNLFKPGKSIGAFFNQLSSQIYFTGIQAILLVITIAIITGVAIVYVSLNQMPQFGIVTYFSRILIDAIVVEISPLVTALVIIGRSATALTVYFGNMKANKEISALQSIGVSYVDYLVMPAFISFIVSLIALNFYFSFFSIIGGLIFASMSIDIPFFIFTMDIINTLNIWDIVFMVSKSIVFGVLISLIASHYGLEVKNFRDVPKVVIKTVVTSSISLIIFSLIFAGIRYGLLR